MAPRARKAPRLEDSEVVADRVLRLDRYQSTDNPKRVMCPNDDSHGSLGVNASGTLLVCGWCDPPFAVSASVIDTEE